MDEQSVEVSGWRLRWRSLREAGRAVRGKRCLPGGRIPEAAGEQAGRLHLLLRGRWRAVGPGLSSGSLEQGTLTCLRVRGGLAGWRRGRRALDGSLSRV